MVHNAEQLTQPSNKLCATHYARTNFAKILYANTCLVLHSAKKFMVIELVWTWARMTVQ